MMLAIAVKNKWASINQSIHKEVLLLAPLPVFSSGQRWWWYNLISSSWASAAHDTEISRETFHWLAPCNFSHPKATCKIISIFSQSIEHIWPFGRSVVLHHTNSELLSYSGLSSHLPPTMDVPSCQNLWVYNFVKCGQASELLHAVVPTLANVFVSLGNDACKSWM